MTSQVFVLTPTDFKGLAMIEDLVPEAKGIAAKVASVSSPSVWEGLGQDKRPTLIFIVKNQEELAILLQKLKVKESLKNQGAMERIL